MSTYTLRVSSGGQVSIPAEVRRRWGSNRVVVIDKGDRVIVRPIPDDPYRAVVGKYADTTPPAEMVRELTRAEGAERDAAQ